jgi:hypothetical protein
MDDWVPMSRLEGGIIIGNTRCSILDTGCHHEWILQGVDVIYYLELGFGNWKLGTGYSILDTGCHHEWILQGVNVIYYLELGIGN